MRSSFGSFLIMTHSARSLGGIAKQT
jgi:hypothetical protein